MIWNELKKEVLKKEYSEADVIVLLTILWVVSLFVEFSFLFVAGFIGGTVLIRYFRLRNKFKG